MPLSHEIRPDQTTCPLCGAVALEAGSYLLDVVVCPACGLTVGVDHWVALCCRDSLLRTELRGLTEKVAHYGYEIACSMELVARQQGFISAMRHLGNVPAVWQAIPPLTKDTAGLAPYHGGGMVLLRSPSGYTTTPYRIGVGSYSVFASRWTEYDGTAWTDASEEPTHWMPLDPFYIDNPDE